MAAVGRKIEGIANGEYPFVEYSIRGIPKHVLRIVVQKNEKLGTYVKNSVWNIYAISPETVITLGWSMNMDVAMRKATKCIREESWKEE